MTTAICFVRQNKRLALLFFLAYNESGGNSYFIYEGTNRYVFTLFSPVRLRKQSLQLRLR